MIIPPQEYKLAKISSTNRRRLTRYAFYFSLLACTSNIISSSTNSWLYTSELLKYYVFPNNTQNFDDQMDQPTFFKNGSLGPWLFCWLDPVTPFTCQPVDYWIPEDPSDVTTSVEQSVQKAFIFMVCGAFLTAAGLFMVAVCCLTKNPYKCLLICTLLHINCGIANFACIIVYMAAVSKEVGNKLYPATEFEDPLFHYNYGYSFVLLEISFLCTEMSALLTVVVYMSIRDKHTFNSYHNRSETNATVNQLRQRKQSLKQARGSSFRRASQRSINEMKRSAPMPTLQEEDEPIIGPLKSTIKTVWPVSTKNNSNRPMSCTFKRPPLYLDNSSTTSGDSC